MPHSSRLTPLENMVFSSSQLRDLWITILGNGDSFNTSRNISLLANLPIVDNVGEKPTNWLAPLNTSASWPQKFVSIRIFRQQPAPFICNSAVQLHFLSSGTTSGPEGRSKSPFSSDGVNLYRGVSMLAFSDMLKKVAGHDEFAGVSLVPTTESWPDSSLARMIHWIGEFWNLSYADYTDIASVRAAVAKYAAQNKPVFIFGTAFHLIDFLDDHKDQRIALPPGSIVIETGGTKGRTRSVTRPELYKLIADGFQISQSHIVSEYGMCELASQAYDFVPHGTSLALSERRFQFPWWAEVRVMSEPNTADELGEGALLIWDQARTDVGAPIQIEDYVKLDNGGRFTLIGRIPTAPLKGCSLKVDEILGYTKEFHVKQSPVQQLTINRDEVLIAAQQVCAWLKDISQDDVFARHLTYEFGSASIAHQSLKDFQDGLPKSSEELLAAVDKALNGLKTIPTSWLVIPASSHSFAAIHLLAVLLACGVDVQVRLSAISHQSADGSSLERIFELMKEHGFKVSSLPGTWKFTDANQITTRAVAIFGDDATIESIRDIAQTPVIGFGNAISGTLVTADELKQQEILDLLIRDNIALSQRGCMSARINLVIGSISDDLQKKISLSFAAALKDQRKFTKLEHTARSLEVVRLQEQGGKVIRENSQEEITVFFDESSSFENILSKQEMCFVFQSFTSEKNAALEHALSQIKLVSCVNQKLFQALSRHIFHLVNLGKMNVPKLDGTLFRAPLLERR